MPTYSILTSERHLVCCEYEVEATSAEEAVSMIRDKEVNYYSLHHSDGIEGEEVMSFLTIEQLEA